MARRFSGLIRRSTKLAALVAAIALTMLMAVPVLANGLHQFQNGANPNGIAWNAGVVSTDDDEDCGDADLDPGQVLWHFIQNQVETDYSNNLGDAELSVTFTVDGASTIDAYKQSGKTLHWQIITGEDTLTSASSNVSSDGQLNLSHICTGGPPPEIPEAPIALLLPVMAVVAFGAYLVINRRRVTSVA
jgi:hypothetical protein